MSVLSTVTEHSLEEYSWDPGFHYKMVHVFNCSRKAGLVKIRRWMRDSNMKRKWESHLKRAGMQDQDPSFHTLTK